MFAPTAASALATSPNALAVIGRPSTTTTWVDIRRTCSPLDSIEVRTDIAMLAMACSTDSCRPSGSRSVATSAPRVSWPRMTTCSTSSNSTPCRINAANSTEVTPGRSGPVTVIRTETLRLIAPSAIGVNLAPEAGSVVLGVPYRLRRGLGRGHLGGSRVCPAPAGVCLAAQPLDQVWVVQLEGRALGTDPGQLGEVVPGRRAAGGPFQGVAVPPRVVHGDHLAVAVAAEDVPDEWQRGGAQDERADRGEGVQEGEPVGGQVVDVAARHAFGAHPVLHQEGGVETDEGQPEVHLAERLVHHPAGHLREPEVDAGVGGEHDRAEQHVVEVRHHEVGVRHVEVDGRRRQQDAGQAAEQEGDQEADREQHRRLEGQLPLPHGADPVEELDPGRNGDQEGGEGEEGQPNSGLRLNTGNTSVTIPKNGSATM